MRRITQKKDIEDVVSVTEAVRTPVENIYPVMIDSVTGSPDEVGTLLSLQDFLKLIIYPKLGEKTDKVTRPVGYLTMGYILFLISIFLAMMAVHFRSLVIALSSSVIFGLSVAILSTFSNTVIMKSNDPEKSLAKYIKMRGALSLIFIILSSLIVFVSNSYFPVVVISVVLLIASLFVLKRTDCIISTKNESAELRLGDIFTRGDLREITILSIYASMIASFSVIYSVLTFSHKVKAFALVPGVLSFLSLILTSKVISSRVDHFMSRERLYSMVLIASILTFLNVFIGNIIISIPILFTVFTIASIIGVVRKVMIRRVTVSSFQKIESTIWSFTIVGSGTGKYLASMFAYGDGNTLIVITIILSIIILSKRRDLPALKCEVFRRKI